MATVGKKLVKVIEHQRNALLDLSRTTLLEKQAELAAFKTELEKVESAHSDASKKFAELNQAKNLEVTRANKELTRIKVEENTNLMENIPASIFGLKLAEKIKDNLAKTIALEKKAIGDSVAAKYDPLLADVTATMTALSPEKEDCEKVVRTSKREVADLEDFIARLEKSAQKEVMEDKEVPVSVEVAVS